MKNLLLILLCVFVTTTSSAQAKKKTYSFERYENSVKEHQWDFSGLLGLYNPGTGFGARAAYRILHDVVPSANDSLSIESGLTFVSASSTVVGTNSSYSFLEIPIHARWDFHVADKKLLVGPVAGINYVTGATVTVGGQNYTISNTGGVYVQLGGSGIYYFSDNFGAQAQVLIGSYTSLLIGVNYAL